MKHALLLALAAGLAIGWLDMSVTEVQGPLLLLMIAAFACALISAVPAWQLAIATTIGLPIAHLAFGAADIQMAMLTALAPVLGAAYVGRGAARLIASSAGPLSQGLSPAGEIEWQTRPTTSVVLLGVALLGCTSVGVVPVYASNLARHQPFAWWVTLIWQTSSFVVWSLAAPALLRVWRNLHSSDASGVSPRELISHAVILSVGAIAHAFALPLLSIALRVPLGEEGFGYAVKWAFAAYLPLDTLTYCLVIGLGHASNSARRLRIAAARESLARGELAASRLASLQAQLQPHFLFNALNAARVLAKRGDSERASNVLGRLSELLRYVLGNGGRDRNSPMGNSVLLAEELAFAEAYLAVERERFPDRLSWTINVGSAVRSAQVPHLLLQPLVENSVKHGVGGQAGPVHISISAEMRGSALVVTVADTGSNQKQERSIESTGIGLENTRARLASLYGNTAMLSFNKDDEGAITRVSIPVGV